MGRESVHRKIVARQERRILLEGCTDKIYLSNVITRFLLIIFERTPERIVP